MAINVNTVYTTVLTILNKEQRGYLTPFEFNNIANQVQLELFEKFFEDYNQYLRMPKTDVEFASRMDHISEEFQVFEKTEKASGHLGNIYTQPALLHRFGSASWNKGVNSPPIEIISSRDYNQIKLSPLTQPTNDFPVAKYQQDKLTVYPDSSPYDDKDVTFNYIRKPILARWGYYAGDIGQFIYDSTVFNDDLLNNNGPLLDFTAFTGAVAGTYTNLAYTTTSTGVGLKIDAVAISATSATFSIATPGTGYSVGDVFNITIGSMGGATAFTIKLTTANFNSGSTYGSTNFEISDSMQTEVILEILKYTGIVIRDPQIIQAASQQLNQEEANSKR